MFLIVSQCWCPSLEREKVETKKTRKRVKIMTESHSSHTQGYIEKMCLEPVILHHNDKNRAEMALTDSCVTDGDSDTHTGCY